MQPTKANHTPSKQAIRKQKSKPDQTKTHYTQQKQEQEPERGNLNIIINARPGSLAISYASRNTQHTDAGFMQAQRKSSTTAWFESKAKSTFDL